MTKAKTKTKHAFQTILELKGVDSIRRSDKELYDSQARNQFANSWPYALLLGEKLGDEGLGLRYKDRNTLITVGVHAGHVCLVPHTNFDLRKFRELADQIYKIVNSPIYIKGISEEEQKNLFYHEFQKVDVAEGLETIILGDDNFPHRVLSVQKSLNLRDNLDIGINDELLESERTVLDKSNKQDAKDVILEWSTARKSNVIGYMNLIDTFETTEGYYTMIYYLQDIPVGFFLARRISSDTVGLYVNVASRHITKGRSRHRASKLFMLDFLGHLRDSDAKFVEWGGSETQSLDNFKCWFNPIGSFEGKMLEYNPNTLPRGKFEFSYTSDFVENQRKHTFPYEQLVFGKKIRINEGVYPAAEDTIQIAKYLLRQNLEGLKVLDMGMGTGYLAWCAKQSGAEIVDAIDISRRAVQCAKENLKGDNINVFESDCFSAVKRKYDLIVAHLPYEEGQVTDDMTGTVYDTNFHFRRRFFEEAPNHLNFHGRIIVASSRYSGGKRIIDKFIDERFHLSQVSNGEIEIYELTLV